MTAFLQEGRYNRMWSEELQKQKAIHEQAKESAAESKKIIQEEVAVLNKKTSELQALIEKQTSNASMYGPTWYSKDKRNKGDGKKGKKGAKAKPWRHTFMSSRGKCQYGSGCRFAHPKAGDISINQFKEMKENNIYGDKFKGVEFEDWRKPVDDKKDE
ncbi:unnamed protein product [Amoebophrya sp. A120]|nr:unnamed protein product [Amoebophrya sp. A120]|eukprot:GSA120T00009234001.1